MGSSSVLEAEKKPVFTHVPQTNLIPQRRFALPNHEARPETSPALHDFGNLSVNADSLTSGKTAQSCPLATPRTCPFGGACHTCPTQVQTKLAISRPGDEYEQEADMVAEYIPAMPEDHRSSGRPAPSPWRRQDTGVNPAPTIPALVQEVLRSPGQPLASEARAFFSPRLGQDFGSVRVHTDPQAVESARRLNACAYTVGRDVVFGPGQYRPATANGRQLLAHELTHVVQQTNGSLPPDTIQRRIECDENDENCQSVPDEIPVAPGAVIMPPPPDGPIDMPDTPGPDPLSEIEGPPTLRSPWWDPGTAPEVEPTPEYGYNPGDNPADWKGPDTLRSPTYEPVEEPLEGPGLSILEGLAFGPTLAASAAAAAILTWSSETAPAWLDEMNPCTHPSKPYENEEEYNEIKKHGCP